MKSLLFFLNLLLLNLFSQNCNFDKIDNKRVIGYYKNNQYLNIRFFRVVDYRLHDSAIDFRLKLPRKIARNSQFAYYRSDSLNILIISVATPCYVKSVGNLNYSTCIMKINLLNCKLIEIF